MVRGFPQIFEDFLFWPETMHFVHGSNFRLPREGSEVEEQPGNNFFRVSAVSLDDWLTLWHLFMATPVARFT